MPAAKSNNGLTIKLSSLKLNPNNPQKFNDLSKLENSIKEFPKMMELRPLVYDPDNNNMILGGNKRLVCLLNMGYKEIPKSWAVSAKDLTDEEKRRFIIADNVPFGEWDEDVLMEFYSEDELEDWGAELNKINIIESDFANEKTGTFTNNISANKSAMYIGEIYGIIDKSYIKKLKDKYNFIEDDENYNGSIFMELLNKLL